MYEILEPKTIKQSLTMRIWLDDERPPPNDNWQICWNFYSVQQIVQRFAFPNHISFDHDLGEELTGHDVAKWLIQRDILWHSMPDDFSYTVHSQNPVGAANIKGVLDRYLRFKSENESYAGSWKFREEESNSI
jgi:hypothetical protein